MLFSKLDECLNSYVKGIHSKTNKITESFDPDDLEDVFDYYGQCIELGRELVYDFVNDQESAEALVDYLGDSLDFMEQLALEGLICNALEGANEHDDARDWTDHIKWSYCYQLPKDAYTTVENIYNQLTTDDEKYHTLCKCLNIMALEGLVTQSGWSNIRESRIVNKGKALFESNVLPAKQTSMCPSCGSKNVKLINTATEANPSSYFGDEIDGEEAVTEYQYTCNECGCDYSDLHVEIFGTKIHTNANQKKINDFILDKCWMFDFFDNLAGVPCDIDGETAFERIIRFGIEDGEISKDASVEEQKKYFLDQYDEVLAAAAKDVTRAADDLSILYKPRYCYKDGMINIAKSLNIDTESFKKALKNLWECRKAWSLEDTHFGPVSKKEVEALYDKHQLSF